MIYNGRQQTLRHKKSQFHFDTGLTIEGEFTDEGQTRFRTWGELETPREKVIYIIQQLSCAFFACCSLYLFLIGLELMHRGFTLMGASKIAEMINYAPSAVPGIVIGIFIGALFQSTAVTRTFVLSFLAAGQMSLERAVFVMIGANIGNTITPHLIALLHLFPKKKFQPAASAASLHFFFTFFTAVIIWPIDAGSRFLIITADKILDQLRDREHSETFESPVDYVTKHVTDRVCVVDLQRLEARSQGQPPGGSYISDGFFADPNWASEGGAGFLLVVIAFVLFAFSIYSWLYLFRRLVGRLTRKTTGKIKKLFYPSVCGLLALIFAFVIQSSSIITSLFIPAAALNTLNLDQYHALSIGANVGASASAFVLALAQTNNDLLRLTLAELLFNLFSAVIWYPLPWLRRIPIYLAARLGHEISVSRWIFLIFIVFVFYFYPWVIYKFSRINEPTLIGAGGGLTILLLLFFFYIWALRHRWWWLPKRLQPTNALREKISAFGPQTEQTTDEDLEYPGIGTNQAEATIQVDIATAENFTNLGIKVGEWNLLPTDGINNPGVNDQMPRRPSISVGEEHSQTDGGFSGRGRTETGLRKPSDGDGDLFISSTSTTSTLTSSSAALSTKSGMSRWAETPTSYQTRPNSVSSNRVSHDLAPEFWTNRSSTVPEGSEESEEKVRMHGISDHHLVSKSLSHETIKPLGTVEEQRGGGSGSDVPVPPPM